MQPWLLYGGLTKISLKIITTASPSELTDYLSELWGSLGQVTNVRAGQINATFSYDFMGLLPTQPSSLPGFKHSLRFIVAHACCLKSKANMLGKKIELRSYLCVPYLSLHCRLFFFFLFELTSFICVLKLCAFVFLICLWLLFLLTSCHIWADLSEIYPVFVI